MSLARACWFVLLLALPVAALGQAGNFEVVKVAEGVYAALRKEPPGYGVESNSVFIVREKDVVVVDAQSSLASTREVLAALRKLTDKPVRYLINTHWHDDHVIGNQVYRDAFPGVEIVAHAKTRTYLETDGKTARKKWREGGLTQFLDLLRGAVRDGKNLAGETLSEEERASYRSDIALGEGYATVPAGFEPALPTLTVEDKLILHDGGRTVEIRHLGRGHTSGDLVVHLPQERIVVAGDLVVWPVPLIGGDQSHVGDWAATLEALRALRPAVIIPGHGPVFRDDSYVNLLARLMTSVRQQTEAVVARGGTLEEARKAVNLAELRKLFAGDSKVRNALFSAYVEGPAVASAFHDAESARAAK